VKTGERFVIKRVFLILQTRL